jgi:hypothetical protein
MRRFLNALLKGGHGMKLLLASVIAVAFAASPVYAQQPADKAAEKAAKEAATEASSKAVASSAETTISSDKHIAPEVMEVVSKKKKYTTSDLVRAQLDAVSKPLNPG